MTPEQEMRGLLRHLDRAKEVLEEHVETPTAENMAVAFAHLVLARGIARRLARSAGINAELSRVPS